MHAGTKGSSNKFVQNVEELHCLFLIEFLFFTSHSQNFKQFGVICLVRLNSHLRFFRRELLCELFNPCNHKKWVHNSLLNFSVHAIVYQIAGVNAPI